MEKGVFLTEDEDKKTKDLYGSFYKKALLKLSSFKESKGVEYQVDYATLHTGGWVFRAMVKDFPSLSEEITKKNIAQDNKKKEEAEKGEKQKVEQEYEELKVFYSLLSQEEKDAINQLAEYELRNFTDKMREAAGKKWKETVANKVRSITSTYRDTGELPEVPQPLAEETEDLLLTT